MAFTPRVEETESKPNTATLAKPTVMGSRKLFMKKNPGSPGKLGKSSTKAESLSKLRGRGALA